MAKKSAGLVVYYYDENNILKVLLVHPGGPFFIKKDNGIWSIPKGEYEEGEDALTVAQREFEEETGNVISSKTFVPLTSVKLKSGKLITAWAVNEYFETPFIKSNLFQMEWPPHSGKLQSFPETDNAAYFKVEEAKVKMYESQHPFVDKLVEVLINNNT